MAPRLNSIGLCVIVVLCILLIFASNRISFTSFSSSSSLSSSSSAAAAASSSLDFSRTFNLPNDRFYHPQSNGNTFGMNLYANNRAGSKYNKIMHPHNTEQRSQYNYRKYGGGHNNINNNDNNNNQLSAETATLLTTNNDAVIINTTVRLEDVLDAQRQRISIKMKDFEYTEDMLGGLSSLTPETNGRPLRSCNKITTNQSIETFLTLFLISFFFLLLLIIFSNFINVAIWFDIFG